jgi:hypothetical protein
MWPLNDTRTAWLHYGWPGKRARLLPMATTNISGKNIPLQIKGYISWQIWLFLRQSEFPTKLSKTRPHQLVCGLYNDVVRIAASDAFRNEVEVNTCGWIYRNTAAFSWKRLNKNRDNLSQEGRISYRTWNLPHLWCKPEEVPFQSKCCVLTLYFENLLSDGSTYCVRQWQWHTTKWRMLQNRVCFCYMRFHRIFDEYPSFL